MRCAGPPPRKGHMRLADAHVHFFSAGYRSVRGVLFPAGEELRAYARLRRRHNITCALAVGYEGRARYRGNNRYLARLCASQPWIHPVAYCPPQTPPSERAVAAWQRQRFCGVSLYVGNRSAAQAVADWPRVAMERLNRWGALVSVNAPMELLPLLAGVFDRLKDCTVLVSHLGLPGVISDLSRRELRQKTRPLRALARLPHVRVKASGFYACQVDPAAATSQAALAAASLALEWYTPARVLWGSDFSPVVAHVPFPQTIGVLDELGLTPSEKRLVAGQNLECLLKVSP